MYFEKELINDSWKFTLTPPDSEISATENAQWYDVSLPHDWLIGDTGNLYKSGCGWYKRSFDITEEQYDGGKGSVIVCFDGVYMDCSVYVNGKLAGEWKYGYTSFYFDISQYCKKGENELLVRVNFVSPNSRWYSGAGIYRSVYLRRTSSHYIMPDGVYVHSKSVRSNSRIKNAPIRLKITGFTPKIWRTVIETDLNRDLEGYIVHELHDPEGRIFAKIERRICGKHDKAVVYLSDPERWDIDNPAVYSITTSIYDEQKQLLDKSSCVYGYRQIRFDPYEGFSLNGNTIKLKGVCLHHDLGALGSAVNYDATLRQIKRMKAMGVNAIRTSHNPPSREFMNICNRLGMLVLSEGFDMWEISKNEKDYARFFDDWYKKDVAAWVRRDRNYPCVIMWSIGNEIPDTHKGPRGLEVARMLTEQVRRHDPSRNAQVTIGSNYMPWENAQSVADFLKIAGYNYAENLYDEHHEKHPDWVIYGSETASTVRSRGIYHFPADVPLLTHEDLQCSDLGNSVVGWGATPIKSVRMDNERHYCMGQFVWTGFDYIGEPTPYSTKNSYFGIVDTAGFPKDSYWFYKSMWDEKSKPFIHISPYWDFNAGQKIDVIVYSNFTYLELFIGSKSVGRHKKNADGYFKWQVPFISGTELKVNAYADLISDEILFSESMPSIGNPTALKIECEQQAIPANGTAMAFVEISAVDQNGNFVANANNRVKVTVEGAGICAGLDNGDSTDYDSYKGEHRKLFSGRMLCMVKADKTGGKIKVTASSNGLEAAELEIDCVPLSEEEQYKLKGIGDINATGYPAVTTPYTNEIPIRKIELTSNNERQLNPDNPTASAEIKILPDNADYSDIYFKCVSDNGVEIDYAKAEFDGEHTVTVTGLGDGAFRLRACAKNGSDIPKVISELEYTATGFGAAVKNPYSFTAACLFDYSDKKVNSIERGALGGFDGKRTLIGFNFVDFKKSGADSITISLGNCGGGDAYPVDVYLGNPDAENPDGKKAEHIGRFEIDFNGGWDRPYPQTFPLENIIKGKHDLYFAIHNQCIFGGFEFNAVSRAFAFNKAADCDNVYGDDFTVNDGKIENIGNNVVISFEEMDFGEAGTSRLAVTARTPLDFCTIQLRTTGSDGIQKTQLIEFPHCDEYTEHIFELEKLCGSNDVSFVFLPGTKLDMEGFKFINE